MARDEWEAAFLEAAARARSEAEAARAAGVTHRVVRYHKRRDPDFRQRVRDRRRRSVPKI